MDSLLSNSTPGDIEDALKDLRSEEHTSELQSRSDLVCRLLLEKKKKNKKGGHRVDDEPRDFWHTAEGVDRERDEHPSKDEDNSATLAAENRAESDGNGLTRRHG